MNSTTESYIQTILKRLSIDHHHKGMSHFAARYLNPLSITELNQLSLDHLNHVLKSDWKFIQSFDPKVPKISLQRLSESGGMKHSGTLIQVLIPNLPFVTDSIITEIRRKGYDIHLILRGIFNAQRHQNILGELNFDHPSPNELLIHIELHQHIDHDGSEILTRNILRIIENIQLSFEDFSAMKAIVNQSQDDLLSHHKSEEAAFLEWILEDNFIFLGSLVLDHSKIVRSEGILTRHDEYEDLIQELINSSVERSESLWAHKSSFTSIIDRNEPLDILRIFHQDRTETICVGILTYAAKTVSFAQIPYIRKKLDHLIEHLSTYGEYFDTKEMISHLNYLPFMEIMNLQKDDLMNISKGILNHKSKYVVLVYPRLDPLLNQTSLLILLNYEKLTDRNRQSIKDLLEKSLGTYILHYETMYMNNDLSCIYAICPHSQPYEKVMQELPYQIANITLSWNDQLQAELMNRLGAEGEALNLKYSNAFNFVYQDRYPAHIGANDVLTLEALAHSDLHSLMAIDIDASSSTEPTPMFQLKFFKKDTHFTLFELFNLLDNFDLELSSETSFNVNIVDQSYWIHDVLVLSKYPINLAAVGSNFKQICQKILSKEVPNDSLNGFVLSKGLNYRQLSLIKAWLSYLKQIQFSFGGKYSRDILMRNPDLTVFLIHMFEAKFDPNFTEEDRLNAFNASEESFKQLLTTLTTEDEDKLFRQLHNLVCHTLRTNYFTVGNDQQPKSYISFKFDSRHIMDIPLPAPMAEIFVYSKEFEAVHLRFGKISRGGIRWSDRGEDYRTEILGLVKAQNTKNSVIVPMGAKGGFYIKKVGANASDAIECYKKMIRGMLDITDNLVHNHVVHPTNVIHYDDADPYLVVAADKGTATFSDIANQVSSEYGFWLHDAFASGGSAGYDHKKMAITSRGAWESVKQHCKEFLNINPETDPITVVGIGDMSGDVFGNGLLRSKTILLKAAFNHQHIFIDPTPDALTSYNERQRLFNLPRSTWLDYDPGLLSTGGMIIERSSKMVTLTPQAKAFLGSSQDTMRPNEIMQAILRSPVDLIWLGGIGTYVKATEETHEAVADRANDGIRINGQELKAKIIAEGANLGFTQKGRIEYALSTKGRINTDFIDNSGGVDCSDHEVNIKILLNHLMQNDQLTLQDRNTLLKQMTDPVGTSVIAENILQNLALSYAEYHANTLIDEYASLTQYLIMNAGLNPAIEFLPTFIQFNERKKLQQGLTRPELAVLMSYAKNHLKNELLKTSVLDHPDVHSYLHDYFPKDLNIYSEFLKHHPLKGEIIATKLTSQMVDRLGLHFLHRLMYQTGKSISEIVNAYIIVKKFFDLESVWGNFDHTLPLLTYDDRIDFIHAVSTTVYIACAWTLMFNLHHQEKEFEAIFNILHTSNFVISSSNECTLPSNDYAPLKKHIYALQQKLNTLQLTLHGYPIRHDTLDLFQDVFVKLHTILNIDGFHHLLKNIPHTTFWDHLFVLSMQLELEYLQGHLTKNICMSILSGTHNFDKIINVYPSYIDSLSQMVQQTITHGNHEAACITVMMGHLRSLVTLISKDLS